MDVQMPRVQVMHMDVRMARGAWMRRSGDAQERLLEERAIGVSPAGSLLVHLRLTVILEPDPLDQAELCFQPVDVFLF
jgi:hypothetical protein